MPTLLRDIPELASLDAPRSIVRIPPELDVPLTDRVRALIDTSEFRRLAHVGQLGLVLHFYHPLVHWLLGRLRLEIESVD